MTPSPQGEAGHRCYFETAELGSCVAVVLVRFVFYLKKVSFFFSFDSREEECPPTWCREHLLVRSEGPRETEEEEEDEGGLTLTLEGEKKGEGRTRAHGEVKRGRRESDKTLAGGDHPP